MGSIVADLEAKGYEFIKNSVKLNGKIIPNKDSFNTVVKTPNGEYKDLMGKDITIGGIKTTRDEITKDLYKPTAEEWCMYKNHYTLKTDEYIKSVMAYYGIVSVMETEENISKEIRDNPCIYTDDFYTGEEVITKVFTFEHPYSKLQVRVAERLLWVQHRFYFNEYPEEIICWDCGRKVHWTETSGDFLQKIDNLSQKYCGCDNE